MVVEVLLAKLKIAPQAPFLLLNAPAEVAALLQPAAPVTTPQQGNTYAAVLLFVYAKAELQQLAPAALQAVAAGGKLWVAYPKKSSALKTDIHRDTGWAPLTTTGWSGVTQIAINDTWSALRFRPEGEIRRKQPRMSTSSAAGQAAERPALVVPDYLQALLEQHPKEKSFFDNLAYTHRKEYLHWITEAKKPQTRERRLTQLVEMLAAGKKNKMS